MKTMRSGKRAMVLGVLCTLAIAGLAAPGVATAHKKRYPTTVTGGASKQNDFAGAVIAKRLCRGSRVVSLYNASGVLIGTTSSNTQGAWKIKRSGSSGKPGKAPKPGKGPKPKQYAPPGANLVAYSVTVKKRRVPSRRGHRHKCKAATTSFVAAP